MPFVVRWTTAGLILGLVHSDCVLDCIISCDCRTMVDDLVMVCCEKHERMRLAWGCEGTIALERYYVIQTSCRQVAAKWLHPTQIGKVTAEFGGLLTNHSILT